VIEDTPSTGWIRRWEERLGLEAGEFEKRTAAIWEAGVVGTISLEDVHRGLRGRLGLEEADVDALMREAWAEYLGTLNDEFVEYFRGLRPRYQTAMLSNSFVGAREREREMFGLEDMTDLIVYSHEVGVAKPDPRIYVLTCEGLGVGPGEAIFVDDTEEMVHAARATGMLGILFRDTARTIEEIRAELDR
jgi:putative hydrolase of the HAD superfamily